MSHLKRAPCSSTGARTLPTVTLLDRQVYWILSGDNDDDEGSVIPPRSVLRIRVEREEVPFYGVRFESKMQRQQALDKWAGRVPALSRSEEIAQRVGVLMAIYSATSIEKNPVDLEFLISRWSTRLIHS